MANVVIFGTGQCAEVAHMYLTHDSPHVIVAFTLDPDFIEAETHLGLPVIPFSEIETFYSPDKYKMFVPISYADTNRLRERKYLEAKVKGYELISYISSQAQTWPDLTVGDNCFILEQNVIQPYVTIGNNVILWSGNHIGHHTTIQDHCFLASHIVVSGSVVIEPYCFLGVNATIRDGITIARENVIGAGALMLKDTQPQEVYMGAKAKLISPKSNELTGL